MLSVDGYEARDDDDVVDAVSLTFREIIRYFCRKTNDVIQRLGGDLCARSIFCLPLKLRESARFLRDTKSILNIVLRGF